MLKHHATNLKPLSGNAESLKKLDDLDRKLLRLLQENGRMTSAELARRVNLSPPGLQKRLKKLEESGTIDRYVTLVNRAVLGLDLLCFVQVTLAYHQPECASQFCDRVQELPEILECHHLTGEFDYLLKIVVRDRQNLETLLSQTIAKIPGVDRIRPNIVLKEVKASTSLPLD
ncbi:Lrp/AsnC family transcriptional regulator [Lusitaniella coriacea]|uniref:Lrp/AsnC family transcriptional regulator n=1 Tax=Lusitaniella coriacea TaxID=1983105 RepID=UPI001D1460B0|nr:Lrp/AsnC family transcriptional regulator [Lusitaniella coriacea]